MSILDIATVAVILLIVIRYSIVPLVRVFGFIKEKQKKNGTPSRVQTQSVSASQRTDDEIINDSEFQRKLEHLEPYYIWMTLAGGTDPLLLSLIYFENERIVLKKRGYDLYDRNIKEYYSGSEWAEREKALELFGQDLFGKYAGEMKRIISLEYIADHLIELEQRTCSSSDFCLTFSTYTNMKTKREQELFKQELQKKWVNATIDVDKNGIMVKP